MTRYEDPSNLDDDYWQAVMQAVCEWIGIGAECGLTVLMDDAPDEGDPYCVINVFVPGPWPSRLGFTTVGWSILRDAIKTALHVDGFSGLRVEYWPLPPTDGVWVVDIRVTA